MFKYAVNSGYLKQSPASGIQQAPEKIEEADFLTREEAERFLQNAEPKFRPVFVVAIYTGMRYGEIASLQWRDVDFGKNQIIVRDPKNSETRRIPMNAAVKEALESHNDGQTEKMKGPMQLVFVNSGTGKRYRDLRKPLRRALDKAKVNRHFRFHDLRHTTGSHLAMAGATEREVAEVLGHKDPKMTRRYTHLVPEHVQRVVDRLDFSGGDDGEAEEGERPVTQVSQ